MNSDMLHGFKPFAMSYKPPHRHQRGDLIWDADEHQQNAPGYLHGPYNCIIVFDGALDDSGELTFYDVIGGWLNLIEEVA